MKSFQIVIISFLLVVNFINSAFCQDITLSWDPSPTESVTGYMVYYKAGDNNLPFNGYEANQGSSPIDVGDNLTATLTDLDDGITYYFSVTAYDYDNNQSTFSNIVNNSTDPIIADPVIVPPINSWTPSLIIPENNALTEPLPVFFRWDSDDRDTLTYTLYYGTDENEVTNAGLFVTPIPRSFFTDIQLIIIAILALLLTLLAKLMVYSNNRIKLQILPVLAVIIFGSILTACGGGGGGGGSASGHTSVTADPATTTTSLYSVETNDEVYYRSYDMSADTTYYWKVIATDTIDTTNIYISEVRKFKTAIL